MNAKTLAVIVLVISAFVGLMTLKLALHAPTADTLPQPCPAVPECSDLSHPGVIIDPKSGARIRFGPPPKQEAIEHKPTDAPTVTIPTSTIPPQLKKE